MFGQTSAGFWEQMKKQQSLYRSVYDYSNFYQVANQHQCKNAKLGVEMAELEMEKSNSCS